MTEPDASLRATLGGALKREAAAEIGAGRTLLDGAWLSPGARRAAARRRGLRGLGEAVEALAFWLFVALVGIGLMLLVTVIV